MPNGYWGRILHVDLSSGRIDPEELPESVYRGYLGGYGLGAYFLYQRMPAGAGPLGPENVLGFLPGLLTGTGAAFGSRFMVVGRSPLTGAWADANCGGDFGPALRGAGYDGVFITGRAEQPVYLFVADGRAEVRDASHLWGTDAIATEEAIRGATARDVRVASIGPAGERRTLLSGIVNAGGRLAARGGLGAVMGSKNLKAIAARGKSRPPMASPEAFKRASEPYLALFRRKPSSLASRIPSFLKRLLPVFRRLHAHPSSGPAQLVIDTYRRYGTASATALLVELGDTPVRNWSGIGYRDFPLALSERLSDDAVIADIEGAYACSFCPVACGAFVRHPDGRKEHKTEYETLASFGPLVMIADLEVVKRCNQICNHAGLDTISVGVTVAFALEAAERGWLPMDLMSELPLRWGDGQVVIELVRRIAARQPGLGEWLADGVLRAAERLGPQAQEAAMHAGGQELSMHRGLYEPGVALGYQVDPAPGRHTSTLSGAVDLESFKPYFALAGHKPGARYDYRSKGTTVAISMSVLRAVDALGLCQFALHMGQPPFLEWLNAATGWDIDEVEFLRIGRRIQVLRHAFNARHGLPAEFPLPARERGDPPQPVGPVAGVTVDTRAMADSYFAAMGLDPLTGLPLPDTLRELGLEDLLA